MCVHASCVFLLLAIDYADVHACLCFFSPARASHTSAQQCQRLRASTPASSEPVTYLITQFDTPRGPPGCVLNFPLTPPSLPDRPAHHHHHHPPPPLHFLFTCSLAVLCCCLCPSFTFNPPAEAKKQRKKHVFEMKNKSSQRKRKHATHHQTAEETRGVVQKRAATWSLTHPNRCICQVQ